MTNANLIQRIQSSINALRTGAITVDGFVANFNGTRTALDALSRDEEALLASLKVDIEVAQFYDEPDREQRLSAALKELEDFLGILARRQS